MKGFLGRPEEAATMISADGWLRPGDPDEVRFALTEGGDRSAG